MVRPSPTKTPFCHLFQYSPVPLLVRYILSQVGLRLSQFSQLSFMGQMGLCVFSLPIALMMIVRIHVLYLIIIIKSEVWPICCYLGLGHETMVCVYVVLYSYTSKQASHKSRADQNPLMSLSHVTWLSPGFIVTPGIDGNLRSLPVYGLSACLKQLTERQHIPVQVTLDISRSVVDFQWGSWKYPG